MKEDIQVSTTQAATMLQCSWKTIVNYCKSGRLIGEKHPLTGVWRISLISVLKLQQDIESILNTSRGL